ncbi:MAG: acyl carrier protein [Oscillospiraceae bacterium]
MTKDEILDRLNNVLKDIFDLPELTINDETKASDIAGWDSLRHIYVLVAIEQEFGISFELSETVETPNIGGLVNIIMRELPE